MCVIRRIFPLEVAAGRRLQQFCTVCRAGVLLILIQILSQVLPGAGFVCCVHAQAVSLWPAPLRPGSPPVFTCRVIRAYPHDPDAFTQGLVFEAGFFFEGTGLNGRSALRKITYESGEIVQQKSLPRQYFGEGVTVMKNRLIQLTWKSRKGFVYDKRTFRQISTFRWPHEGWGITQNSAHLIISDGSDRLFFVDPVTFDTQHVIFVRDNNRPVRKLNELEFVEGFVLANIWQTDRIAVIEPGTGQVAAWIQLGRLAGEQPRGVPNGIAYDRLSGRLFITGKRWSRLFEVVLVSGK